MSGKFRGLERILVANRGEIACRILSTIREMGLTGVAVHSDADASSLHRRSATESVGLGASDPRESYLSIDKIIAAAISSNCQAIHPGYGFLSENPDFADAVERAGLQLIGPPASAIRAMGSKARARQLMIDAGVPVVPGYHGEDQLEATFLREAERLGLPLLVKAAAGGGGKGMRIVRDSALLAESLASSRRESEKAFGDGRLLLERYIERPRHVEVQIFGDESGDVIHLFDRDCSIQRRHQKVIEEAPAPGLGAETREAMGAAAVTAAKAVGYTNAGTVEFVVDPAGNFFFLEMNTRLQVEHPVTESILGLNLVAWQIRIARGENLPRKQSELSPRGCAMEARLYAEDPENGFLPSVGRILRFDLPTGPGLRVDTGVSAGSVIPIEYDPILAKIVAFGETREDARRKLIRALDETIIFGIKTNLSFLRAVAAHPAFAAGDVQTHFLEEHFPKFPMAPVEIPPAAIAAALLLADVEPARAGMAPRAADPWERLDKWGRN